MVVGIQLACCSPSVASKAAFQWAPASASRHCRRNVLLSQRAVEIANQRSSSLDIRDELQESVQERLALGRAATPHPFRLRDHSALIG